jgi:Fe-S oxidoreductase
VIGAPAAALAERHRPVAMAIAQQEQRITHEPSLEEVASSSQLPVLKLAQHWPEPEALELVAKSCNGCGRCRTTGTDQRMCPVFRALPSEEASPRAKANLLRAVLAGELEMSQLATNEAYAVATSCFGCQQCHFECPANVDIPKLATEIKSQYVATNGLPLSQLWLTRLDRFASLGSRVPRTTNAILRSSKARWVIERLLGVTQRRALPPIATRNFMRWAAKRRLTRSHRQEVPKVAYFVDYFATWHDIELAQALVHLFKHNGFEVYVPPTQTQSWMPKIAVGDLANARRGIARNVKLLADAVRQGYEIVTTEPSAALCLKREYGNVLGTDDAELVAQHSHDAGVFLWDLHRRNALKLDLQPVAGAIAYHQPCHMRAIDRGNAGLALMGLIPGLQLQYVDAGCSGMAGMYGLHRDNYRNSLRIGWPLISAMRKSTTPWAASECTACRMQIEHGTHKTAVHPLKVLAHAYGYLPGLGLASTK